MDPESGASAAFRREGVQLAVRRDERRRRVAEAAAPLGFVAALVAAAIGGAFRETSWMWAAVVAGAVSLVATALGAARAREVQARAGTIAVEGDALVVEVGERVERHALGDIDAGYIDPAGHTRLRLKSGLEIVAELERADGEELLTRLHLRAHERATSIPVASPLGALGQRMRPLAGPVRSFMLQTVAGYLLPLYAILFGMGSGAALWEWRHSGGTAALMMAPLILLVSMLGVVGATRLRRRRRVTVGADGIELHGYWRKRFVPWAKVDRVVASDEGGAVLHLVDGSRHALAPAPGGESLLARIRDARLAWTQREGAGELEALDRGERSGDAWREHLQAMAEKREGYRESRLEVDQLAAVVGDSGSPPDRRVGAALMLGKMDDGARERVRIAIDACAEDDMKAALASALEGEIAEDEIQAAERRR
jgi:hypothetical protein